MNTILKSLLYYMLMLSAFALMIFTIGCSAENPICSTNFCAVGEVFPRSELEAAAIFSEVDVDDSVIFATLIGGVTPVETAETPAVDSVTFADIVADVAAGGTEYLNQTVTIRADVRLKLETGSLALQTHDDKVFFFITDRDNSGELERYNQLSTYNFTIYIRSILPPDEDFDEYAVFSALAN